MTSNIYLLSYFGKRGCDFDCDCDRGFDREYIHGVRSGDNREYEHDSWYDNQNDDHVCDLDRHRSVDRDPDHNRHHRCDADHDRHRQNDHEIERGLGFNPIILVINIYLL